MSTSYIFLAGALFLFVIAIVILFMGKGKKDDKKVDKEFDENYAVNINEVYLRTGDVRETLVQMEGTLMYMRWRRTASQETEWKITSC